MRVGGSSNVEIGAVAGGDIDMHSTSEWELTQAAGYYTVTIAGEDRYVVELV